MISEGVTQDRGDKRNAYKDLVGKPEAKQRLRRYRRAWDSIIATELNDRSWVGLGCLGRSGELDL